jgi:hypothetical protein
MDLDGVQALVLHPQAELFVDFLDAVLLQAIAHALAIVHNGHIATLNAGYFGRHRKFRQRIKAPRVANLSDDAGETVSPGFRGRRDRWGTDGYRFLRAADLAASAAFFFWLALSA